MSKMVLLSLSQGVTKVIHRFLRIELLSVLDTRRLCCSSAVGKVRRCVTPNVLDQRLFSSEFVLLMILNFQDIFRMAKASGTWVPLVHMPVVDDRQLLPIIDRQEPVRLPKCSGRSPIVE